MKKLNDLIKTKYYAVYEKDNCIGAYIDNDDYDNSNIAPYFVDRNRTAAIFSFQG